MPELRKDPIIGRWIIIATNRARRPGVFFDREEILEEESCPFCEGNESQTPEEIYSIRQKDSQGNSPGWQVRVVPSINPFFKSENELNRSGKGLYDVMKGVGVHEMVIETPKHTGNMADLEEGQIELILHTFRTRMNELEKDVRFKYVLAFKNCGHMAGGRSIKHSRSQIIATPVTPMQIKEELRGAKKYFEFHDRCIFCDMIKQEIDSKERVVAQNDSFVAITPFASRSPFEIWILPRKHSCDFPKESPECHHDLAKLLKEVLCRIKEGLEDPAYNFVLHSAPFRRDKEKWKTIEKDYHWHIEIIPRLTRVAGFEKGTDFYICSIPPEDTAQFLREVKITEKNV